jgi:hypothetical protein
MKVGDYVRTKEFGISRIKWFDNEEPILENGFTALQKEYKSSPNIIDLIEVGDYVNGSRVIGLEGNGIYDKLVNVEERNHYNILPDDIKSILTKEQYKSAEYVF